MLRLSVLFSRRANSMLKKAHCALIRHGHRLQPHLYQHTVFFRRSGRGDLLLCVQRQSASGRIELLN